MRGPSRYIPINIGAFLQVRFDKTRRSLMGEAELANSHPLSKIQKFITWQWHAPQPGSYSLNCDGAVKGSPGPAVGGGIIRDHQGIMVSSFHANYGHCTTFKAKVKALKRWYMYP